MMQSLLADRFKLAAHFETREGSLFALTLVNPGNCCDWKRYLPVIDRTGLAGAYDFTMEVFGTGIASISGTAQLQANPADPPDPTFLDAMRDQLGLKLEPIKGPVQSSS